MSLAFVLLAFVLGDKKLGARYNVQPRKTRFALGEMKSRDYEQVVQGPLGTSQRALERFARASRATSWSRRTAARAARKRCRKSAPGGRSLPKEKR